jgi:hypothetical protein
MAERQQGGRNQTSVLEEILKTLKDQHKQDVQKREKEQQDEKVSREKARAEEKNDQNRKARQGAFGSALGGAAASAVKALLAPMRTSKEREAEFVRGSSSEAAAASAIALSQMAGADTALQMRAGEFAAQATGAAVDAAYHEPLQKIQGVRSGFADIEQLMAAGVDMDDDFLRRRARSLHEMENRRYEAQGRINDVIDAEFKGDMNDANARAQQEAAAAMERFLRDVQSKLENASARADGARDQDVRSTRAT